MTNPILSELSRVLPADRLLAEPVRPTASDSDAPAGAGKRPLAVVQPETQDEVIAVVRWCRRRGVSCAAWGGGAGVGGESLPLDDGIVIAMNRLNRIKKLDPEQRIVVVEAGVTHLQIAQAANGHGLCYAPSLFSQSVCTMGEEVALNSGGAQVRKYGATSSQILGLRLVLADGEVVELGSGSAEGVGVGPDLVGLFVGCRGALGIALEITVRLLPKPARRRTVLATYRDLKTAEGAAEAVVQCGLLPGAMGMMDRRAIEAAEASVRPDWPAGVKAVLIVELDGAADQVERELYHLRRVIEETEPDEMRIVESAQQRWKLWQACPRVCPPLTFSDVDVEIRRQVRRETASKEIADRGDRLPGAV
ncbi:MAG: FAD-binding protein [Candidatus Anammoximicrobium sp.]|nr:FAD-binding protein [Candidatus Anammoximicrobium sp.]